MSVPVCDHYFDEWGARLLAPLSMIKASMPEIMRKTNGCGRAGWEERAVPDTVYGLDISCACRVHDWMCGEAEERSALHQDQDRLTEEEIFADKIFAANLVGYIKGKTPFAPLCWLRLRRIFKYVDAVVLTDVCRVLPRETIVAMRLEAFATDRDGDALC